MSQTADSREDGAGIVPVIEGFTPGPWYAAIFEDHITVARLWDFTVLPGEEPTYGSYLGAHICDVKFGLEGAVPTKERALANAELLALAPTLYAEYHRLREVEKVNGELVAALEMAQARYLSMGWPRGKSGTGKELVAIDAALAAARTAKT